MSHEATKYVKGLVMAPDGSTFKAAEKAVLMVLADSYNEEVGCAWPSMKKVANSCSISDRYCRQLIEGLERKEVIRRIFSRRELDRSQTTNEYTFRALERAIPAAIVANARRKFQRVSRVPISGGSRAPVPRSHERGVRGTRMNSSAPAGTQAPTIDPLGEQLRDSGLEALIGSVPPTPQNAVRTTDSSKPFPGERTRTAFQDMRLALTAWDEVIEDLRKGLLTLTPLALEKRSGFVNGSKDWQSFRFNEVTVEAVEMDAKGGVVLILSSPNPKATARGLQKYQKRIALTLTKFYGCMTTLRLQGRGESPEPN